MLFYTSCQQDLTKKNQELIIGEWYPLDYIIIEEDEDGMLISRHNLKPFNMTGYQFMEDGLCENKLGYYEYAKSDAFMFSYPDEGLNSWLSAVSCPWLDNIIYSYGHTTPYNVNDSILNIYNPSLKQYNTYKLEFNTRDTMILSHGLKEDVYVRKKYEINDNLLFDKIIFFFPSSEFFDKPKIFSISKGGDFYMFDCKSRSYSIMQTNVLDEDFDKIEILFRKAKFDAIKDSLENLYCLDYFKNRGEEIGHFPTLVPARLTFISKNKVFSIGDVFEEINYNYKEFYWAYLYGLFYYEQMRLKQPNEIIKSDDWQSIFSKTNDFSNFVITKKDSVINLYNTEAFHLVSLLRSAIKTDVDFTAEYKLKESFYSDNEIETDGRFFRYRKGKKTIIFDIGFNFIVENNFEKYLRKITGFENDVIRLKENREPSRRVVSK